VKNSNTKQVRFRAIVDACGEPEIASLWTSPERDKNFRTAVRQNRVLSVKQQNVGSKKDFGQVGFLRDKNISWLIFPKTLKAFENQRVIGINYDLVRTAGVVGTVVKAETKKTAIHKRPGVVQPRWTKPTLVQADSVISGKKFSIKFRFVAEVETVDHVEASTRKEAIKIAEGRARTPDFSKGVITRRILKVSEA